MNELLLESLFPSKSTIAYSQLSKYKYACEAVTHINDIISEIIGSLGDDFCEIEKGIFVHRGAHFSKNATLVAPCIIDDGAEIRHSAYLRGNTLVGKGCVVGNSCELKSAILFDGATVPHFNYVGNSILGYKAHLGAGAVISNLKSDKSNVTIKLDSEKIDTGVRKFGALVGDYVEVGCGSVLNPGTVIMPQSNVYPLSSVRGTVPPSSIYKSHDNIVKKR